MEGPPLKLEKVTKAYGREKAVDEVTLDLAAGERLALLGHNGAGKTTLLKLALGLTRADGGAVTTLGCAPGSRGWTAAKRSIGFLPESVAFLGSMTGLETIRFYGRLKGAPKSACEEALAHVGLAGVAGKRVKTYSKGMRQRLGFAQAILGAPRLLILDEPTGGLDPESRHDFHATLRALAGRGTAIILSSHVLTEVEAGTDRVAIMRRGPPRRLRHGGRAQARGRPRGHHSRGRAPRRWRPPRERPRRQRGDTDQRSRRRAPLLSRREAGADPTHSRRGRRGRGHRDRPPRPRCGLRALRRFRAGGRAVTAVAAIAGREVLAGIRNRWMLAASLLLGLLALTLAFIGSSPVGAVAASPLAITVVSLSSLSVFLVPLIGLLVSYDTLVGEIERGTMPLLMTHPVTRWRIVVGKFAGQVAILAVATVAGFGVAALITGLGGGGDAEAWGAFGVMVGGSILLGAAFIALGTLFSAVVAERGTAAGVSAAAWLVFVVLFDMALLAILVADEGQVVSGDLFRVFLLLNPTDVYRMLTLSGSETVGALSGMAGVSAEAAFGHALLLPVMLLWIAVPLGLAGLLFGRKEL